MAGQADGSIIIDTELNSDGFKAGSAELLAAIKSLSEEVKNLGATLKELFRKPLTPTVNTSGAEDKVAALEAKIHELEASLSALQKAGARRETATPEVDISGPSKKASNLQREIDSLSASVERLGPTFQKAMSGSGSAVETFDRKAAALENKIELIREKMAAVAQTKYPTQEYERISAEVEKAGQKLETLLTKQERMQELGVKENSKQWKQLQYDLTAATQKYEDLEAVKARYESEGKAFQMGADTAQYKQMQLDIEAANQALREMQNELGRINNKWAQMPTLSGMVKNAFQSVADKVKSAFATVKNAVTHPLQGADRLFGALIVKARQLAATAARMTVSRLVSGLKSALSTARRLAKANVNRLVSGLRSALSLTKQLTVGNRDYDKSLKKLTKTAKKFTLSLLGAKSVWMLLRKAINAYISENQALANLQAGVWASVGSILGPVIERVVTFAAKAVSYLTAFLHLLGLTGSTAAKAATTAGKAAEKETKELQRQLASFDELNILSDNKSDSKDGTDTGSSVKPLADAELPDWAKLIAEKLKAGEWEEAATILADQLNAMVDSVDWAGIGDKLGYGINGALTFLATFIKKFRWKALGSDLATMLNHIVTGVDWGNLGFLLVAGLAIAMQMLTGFFDTLDPKAITKAIYDFIMGGVNGVNWPKLTGELFRSISNFIVAVDFLKIGTALGAAIQTILSSLNAALSNFDWDGLGTQLGNLLNGILTNVNWGSLGDLLSGLFRAVLLTAAGLALTLDWAASAQGFSDFAIHFFTGIADAISSVDWQQIGRNVATFLSQVDWSGVSTALFTAIGAVLGGLAVFLWGLIEEAWKSVVQWWHDVAFKDGKFTISGLLNGIVEALKNIGKWIYDHILTPFIDGFKAAFGIHSPSTVMFALGGYIIEGLLNGIKNAWKNIKTLVTKYAKEIWTAFKNKVKDMLDVGKKLMGGLKDGLVAAWDKVKTKVSEYAKAIWQGFKDKANNLERAGSELITKLKEGLAAKWSDVKMKVSGYASDIKSGFEAKKESLKTVGSNLMVKLKDGLNNGWNSVSTTISTLGTRIWQGFNNQVSNLKTVGSNLMSGLRNGLVERWNSVVTDVSTIANNITSTLKKAFGEHSPSKIWAQIGRYLMEGLDMGLTDEKKTVLSTVSGIASAVSDEMAAGDYSIPPIDIETSVKTDFSGMLDGFTDTITDKFSAMLDRLQAIANRVTFAVPSVASGLIPYQLTPAASVAGGDGLRSVIEASNDELESVVIQSVTNATAAIVRAIEEHSGTTVNLDKDSITQMVIDDINRRTRMMNENPLLV